MGKVRGGDLSVRQDAGIPVSDPSLGGAKGGEAPPFGFPGHCGRSPRPPLFRSWSSVAAWLGCPLSVHSAQLATGPKPPLRRSWGAAGGPEARWRVPQRRGWGGGEAVTHPGRTGTGADLPGQRDAALSGSRLLIAAIAVAVRLPRRGAAEPCPVVWRGLTSWREPRA
jgi:hypothetical protein